MPSRRQLLLSTLLFPAFDARAGTAPPAPYTAPPSQPGTTELAPRHPAPAGPDPRARLAYWYEIGLRTLAIDHTRPPAGPAPVAEQRGRTRSSRALAIVHLAVY